MSLLYRPISPGVPTAPGIYPKVTRAIEALSPFERLLFMGALVAAFITGSMLLLRFNAGFLVEIPAHGGTLTEGIVGIPRLINPLLAESEADQDLTALLFAGLMRRAANGELVGELAASYSVSTDGLGYTFLLKPNTTFHDGTPLTAYDVAFTIARAQDLAVESPVFVDFEGVTVTVISAREILLTLPAPYEPFIETMTLGILPKHIWESQSAELMKVSEFNTNPVGAGPFKIEKVERDAAGIALSYQLTSFKEYARNEPHIEKFTVRLFRNEDDVFAALLAGTIDGASSISPLYATQLKDTPNLLQPYTIYHETLPRLFGVFFNHNSAPVLLSADVRRALSLVLNRESIITATLSGFGTPITGPFALTSENTTSINAQPTDAAKMLMDAGWQLPETAIEESSTATTTLKRVWTKKTKSRTETLAFTITTAEIPELVRAANEIVRQWRLFGADVTLLTYPPADLARFVIRPRKFESLLFGMVLGREQDVYAFWHSSQRNDPGLNIASYTNIAADQALKTLRSERNGQLREEAKKTLIAEIEHDTPAVFLFSPQLIYALSPRVQKLSLTGITSASDRFGTVSEWYIETDSVWKFLAPLWN